MAPSTSAETNRTVAIAPSDILQTAADEIGNCLAIVRTKAIKAIGDEREELFIAYDELLGRLQDLVRSDLRAIDADPSVQAIVGDLGLLTQRIAKVKREMRSARAIIDRIHKVIGWVDEILGLL